NLRLIGSNKSDQGKLRHRRCGREIAERTHHRFPADVARVRRRHEMYACDNTIGFEHKKSAAIAGFHYSAIVTRTADSGFCERKVRQKLADKLIFSDLAQFHCRFQRYWRYVSLSMGCCLMAMDNSAPSAPALRRLMEKRSPEMRARPELTN